MRVAGDLFTFVARLAIGVVLIAHGLQRLLGVGVDGTALAMAELGVPTPVSWIVAWYVTLVELVGGVLFILGLALPVVAVLVAIDKGAELFLLHLPFGLFLPYGYEYALVLGTAALALGFHGGRWSLDYALLGRHRRERAG